MADRGEKEECMMEEEKRKQGLGDRLRHGARTLTRVHCLTERCAQVSRRPNKEGKKYEGGK